MVKNLYAVKRFLALILSIVCMVCAVSLFSVPANAAEVNNVTGESSKSTQSSSSNENSNSVADGLADAFRQSAVDNNDLKEATALTAPAVKFIRTCISIVLAMFSAFLGFITVLDLLYIMVPPVRNALSGGQGGSSQQPMGGGMGMHGGFGGGYGGGYGGSMGMGATQQKSGMMRFVSDEAIAALNESTGQQGGNMGGGFGMGMGAQQQPKAKVVILSYAKKRAFALVCFFACLVLFTSTVFSDVGLYIGQWLVDTIGSWF